MWFWIAVMATVLVVVLLARALVGRRGGIDTAGPREGYDVGVQGVWSARHGSDRTADAGGGWGGWGGGGWDGGDGAGGGE